MGGLLRVKESNNFVEKLVNILIPVKDHRGNEKVERTIKTVNERLRTQKKVILERRISGLSTSLFAIRSQIGEDRKSEFKKHKGHEHNTLKSAITNGIVSENGSNLEKIRRH